MTDLSLTAEPHFWIKQVWLPLLMGVVGTILVSQSAILLTFLRKGYRAARSKQTLTALSFARKLGNDRQLALIWMMTHLAFSIIPLASCCIGSAFFVIGYVGSKDFPQDLALGAGSIMIGMSSVQLFTHALETAFILKATMSPEKLQQRLQSRLDRLNK
jgi:hypothetical protein